MRIVVTGATGNVGTAVLRRLHEQGDSTEVVGVARHAPDTSQPATAQAPYARARWVTCDVGDPSAVATLTEAFAGADAVVHLAWQIQPSRDEAAMARTNVDGTAHVSAAAVAAGVPHLVHMSSVGTYATGPYARRVDESWSTAGIHTSTYSRQKSAAESHLDDVQRSAPGLVIARVRPSLIMQAEAGSEIGRYFLGRVLAAAAPVLRLPLPVVPLPPRLRLQLVHTDDVADALLRVVGERVGGGFNLAAEPVLRAADVARLLGGRLAPVPPAALRALVSASYATRVQPTEPGWFDLGMGAPLMDTTRARTVLGWSPRVSSQDALREVLSGLARGAGTAASPKLAPRQD